MTETVAPIGQPAPSLAGEFKNFLFAKEIPYGLALVRISLPLVLLVDVVRRWPWARELYSTDGSPAPIASNFGYPGYLPEFSGPVTVGLFTALTLFLVTTSVGWRTRFSLVATTVLYFYFMMMDVLSTISKYTVIANHLLLLLSVSACGDLWSVDAWLRRRRARQESPAAALPDLRSPIWPQRLAQILFGMIYFGAAITKLHTPEFFSGDQLVFWMITNLNNEHSLGEYMSQHPLAISVSCFITFLWELIFIFTIWNRKLKWPMLAVGTVFHVMTVFTLGLIIFPIVIMAAYMAFLDEADIQTILNWRFVRWLTGGRLAVPPRSTGEGHASLASAWRGQFGSMATFALTTILVCLAGIEAEHLLDHYQMRGPQGSLPLRELTDEEVQQLFGPERPLRQCDKMLAFDLGKTLVGEHLASFQNVFRHGDQLVAQVTLNPPHEDMWIDCVLCESTTDDTQDDNQLIPGRMVSKVGQVVLRERSRGNFFFRLDSALEPGDYFMKLRSGNEEVARKHFVLRPGVQAAAAN